jgi:translation elongation factor EF-Tu-like GTPase
MSDSAAETQQPFRMVVREVFSIKGRGTLVTGRIESGAIWVEDVVRITWPGGAIATTVIGIEIQQSVSEKAVAGDEVGLLLRGVEPDDIQLGALIEKREGGAAPPTTVPGAEESFRMVIKEVFVIKGRGTMVTGRVEQGTIHVLDRVRITGVSEAIETVVTALTVDQKTRDEAKAGDSVGLLLRGVEQDRVKPGDSVEIVR